MRTASIRAFFTNMMVCSYGVSWLEQAPLPLSAILHKLLCARIKETGCIAVHLLFVMG